MNKKTILFLLMFLLIIGDARADGEICTVDANCTSGNCACDYTGFDCYCAPAGNCAHYNGTGYTVGGNVFTYRRPITIDNTGNSNTLTNYQVNVTVDTQTLISNGKMQSDCDDIRFTDSDGSTLIDYWLESGCNSGSTKLWVEVPSIPASSTKTIYMYYGNSSVSSTSNGANTFIAFEDFATDPGVTSQDIDIDGHAEKWAFGFTFPATTQYRLLEKHHVVEYYGASAFSVHPMHLRYVGTTTTPNFFWGDCVDNDCTTNQPATGVYGGSWYQITVGQTYEYKFVRNGASLELYLDGNLVSSSTAGDSNAQTEYNFNLYDGGGAAGYVEYNSTNRRLRIYDYRTDTNRYIDLWIDDIRLAKYADPEPTTSVGSEEGGCDATCYGYTSTPCTESDGYHCTAAGWISGPCVSTTTTTTTILTTSTTVTTTSSTTTSSTTTTTIPTYIFNFWVEGSHIYAVSQESIINMYVQNLGSATNNYTISVSDKQATYRTQNVSHLLSVSIPSNRISLVESNKTGNIFATLTILGPVDTGSIEFTATPDSGTPKTDTIYITGATTTASLPEFGLTGLFLLILFVLLIISRTERRNEKILEHIV